MLGCYVQVAAERTPIFRKITVGSQKQIVGCGPFRWVGYIIKFSVVAMPWSGEHRGFAVAAFFKKFPPFGHSEQTNFRYWAAENPRELHARPLPSPKVTVWCTLSSIGVIGPYFFWRGWSHSYCECQSVCDMLDNFLRPKIDEYGEEHNLVLTGWSYGPYSTSSARSFGDVPGTSGLLTRGSSVATALGLI
jgi:hypothetical protein